MERKHTRLKEYDYSKNGYYFVTICAKNKKALFGKVNNNICELNIYGKIVEKVLKELENTVNNVFVDKYIIMPNHIHIIFIINGSLAGASPRPTLNDVVCRFKSVATRECNQVDKLIGRKIFQTSYYEHIIRSKK